MLQVIATSGTVPFVINRLAIHSTLLALYLRSTLHLVYDGGTVSLGNISDIIVLTKMLVLSVQGNQQHKENTYPPPPELIYHCNNSQVEP